MESFEIEILNSKQGLKTVMVNKYLLHSKYNPEKEAEEMAEREFKHHYVHILFGYGMGYIAEHLRNKIKDDNKLLIIDPLKKHLKISKEDVYDFESLDGTFKDKIRNSLDNNNREVKIICSPNYNKIFPEEYKKLLQLVKDIQRDNQVEENTIRRFSEYWEENYTKNLFSAVMDPSLNTLENLYKCPIVVASGGPSLIKQLILLKKIRKNVILIASGSTINTLLKYSIEPDYVVSIDGDEENYHHFKDLLLKNVDLLYSMSSKYEIQKEYIGNRFPYLTFNDSNVRRLLYEKLGINFPLIAGGGSVATFALSIAKYITSGPIALIGQDLAYTNNETHAKSNKYYKEIDADYLKKIGAFEIEGYFGDKVMTDYAFLSMKNMFEQIQSKIPHVAPVYNCTEGGAKINGFDQVSFDAFISMHVSENQLVNKVEINNTIEKLKELKKLEQYLLDENLILKKLEKLCIDTIAIIKSTSSKFEFNKATLNKMDKNDNKIREYFKQVRMQRIFEPLVIDILRNYKNKENETPKESFQRVYNQNNELYTRLLDTIKKAKNYNIETIEYIRLEEV